jgi:hypothetical protein
MNILYLSLTHTKFCIFNVIEIFENCFNYEEPAIKHLAIMLDRIGCISETENKHFNTSTKYFHVNVYHTDGKL